MMKLFRLKVLDWMRFAVPCALLAAVVALGGCSPEDEGDDGATEDSGDMAEPEADDSAKAWDTEAIAAAGEAEAAVADHHEGGSGGVTGVVKLAGPRPDRPPLKINDECKDHVGGEPILSEAAVVDENGGLRWAFVYVTNPPEGDYPPPEEPAVLDQVGCAYTPHVLGVQAGQRLKVVNSDPLTHNVRAIARKNRPINYGQPAGTDPRIARATLTAKDEDHIQINCDIHRWMRGYMFVKDHPFFAVTAEDGSFTINDLPDGTYDLTIWHETFGEQNVSITVEDGSASTSVTFEG